MKLWAGRFQKELDEKTNDFNSSIAFDSRMAEEDIAGSHGARSHAAAAGDHLRTRTVRPSVRDFPGSQPTCGPESWRSTMPPRIFIPLWRVS